MSVSLLDINVLVALFDPAHIHHEPAHRCTTSFGQIRFRCLMKRCFSGTLWRGIGW